MSLVLTNRVTHVSTVVGMANQLPVIIHLIFFEIHFKSCTLFA